MKKKSELDPNWIKKLEGTEKAPWWSMNEVQDFVHQQVPKTSANMDAWDNLIRLINNGAGITGLANHGHWHDERQKALLKNLPDLLKQHTTDDHFNGSEELHDKYHE